MSARDVIEGARRTGPRVDGERLAEEVFGAIDD